MPCIICGIHDEYAPIEHIVSESLGNKQYVLTRGDLCRTHNTMFSEFEAKALTKTILGMERVRMGIPTKKGKAAASKTGPIEFKGDKGFRQNLITVFGLTESDTYDFDPSTGIFKISVLAFDKTEVPTSKLLLKMGLESLAQSRRSIYDNYNLDDVRNYLDNKSNIDWPFIVTGNRFPGFESIPQLSDKNELAKIRCELLFREENSNTLLFYFIYGGVSMIVNIVDRNLDWIKPYIDGPFNSELYPAHFRKRISPSD